MRACTLAYGPFDVTTYGGGLSVLVKHRQSGREAFLQGDEACRLVDDLEDQMFDHARGVGRAGRFSERELSEEILGCLFD